MRAITIGERARFETITGLVLRRELLITSETSNTFPACDRCSRHLCLATALADFYLIAASGHSKIHSPFARSLSMQIRGLRRDYCRKKIENLRLLR